jgi:hypothetical protein
MRTELDFISASTINTQMQGLTILSQRFMRRLATTKNLDYENKISVPLSCSYFSFHPDGDHLS